MSKFSGSKMTIFDGASAKSINPWDVDSDKGWINLSGDEVKTDEALYFKTVPWLYRATKDRANNVSHMPYVFLLNGEDYDYEADPNNVFEWCEGLTTIWHKLEMSLCLMGRAYAKLGVNPSGYIKYIRYLVPTSIKEVYYTELDADPEHPVGSIKHYEHTVGRQKEILLPSQIVAIYDPDWTTENGAGNTSAAMAALTSAGVLYHTDIFIAKYFQRGAIKVTIFTTLGFDEVQAQRLQRWWDRQVSGIKNALRGLVLKGETIKPVVIGEGLESLQNETLTSERRQNISTALGVPESRMWSAAANYATRVQDDKAYYEGTIIPENELIEEAWNEQILTAEHNLEGFTLQFKPEALDIFQEGAADQAATVKAFVDAGTSLLMAFDLAGVELTDVQRAELETKEAPKPVPPQLAPFTGQQPTEQPALPAPAPVPEAQPSQDYQNAMAMWQRKAIKRFKESGDATCLFSSEVIPEDVNDRIIKELAYCKSIDDVKAVFAGSHQPEPLDISDQLKRALDWLERHEAQEITAT